MFSFLSSIIQFFMYWVFMYVGTFLVMIVGIVWIIKTIPRINSRNDPTYMKDHHKRRLNRSMSTLNIMISSVSCYVLLSSSVQYP